MKNLGDRYAAVRRSLDADDEWIDTATIAVDWSMCQDKADSKDREIPTWAKANPVVRIARVTITEVQP